MSFFSKSWFPAAVVSIAIAASLSDGAPAPETLGIAYVSASPDTVIYPKNGYKLRRKGTFDAASLPDSVLKALGISIDFADDSMSMLTARDTIFPPDSLRLTDPFRYKYYVALLDSLTHRIVSDSLLASYRSFLEAADTARALLDSSDRFKLDSLYRADSTLRAREAFLAWYNGLTPEERKKYDYEQKVKRKLAIADSIRLIKEREKEIRDSIRESTPRVLETFAFPDSMQFKRIVTWTVDQDFHDIDPQEPDTSYNHYFNDFAFRRKDVNATWLGVAGSPVQTYDFFKREDSRTPDFYSVYEPWSYNSGTLPMYNTKTPHTELAYWGNLLSNDDIASENLHIMTTQNILPSWNFNILYERWGGGGMLINEETNNKTFSIGTNYVGKKYMLHAGYISNTVTRQENGGLADLTMVRDTTVNSREMPVVMSSNAESSIRRKTYFLDQQYRIPFTFLIRKKDVPEQKNETSMPDSLAVDPSLLIPSAAPEGGSAERKDSLDTGGDEGDVTTAFIGHSTEWTTYERKYTDNISSSNSAARALFNDTFNYNGSKSADSLRTSHLENKLFLRLQPWAADAIVSKLDVGVGDVLRTYFDSTATRYKVNEHSLFTYAGANGRYGDMDWSAKARLYLQGAYAGDMSVQAEANYSFYPFRRARKSPVTLGVRFETSLKTPDYYQRHIYANHYRWDSDFDKTSLTRLQGSISVPHWKLSAKVGYALLANNIYYDTQGIARQNAKAMSVLSAQLRKDFVVADLLHFDNNLLMQLSSDEDVLPLPAFAVNSRLFMQFIVQRNDEGEKVLELQLGADALCNTKWYAPAWNPNLGVFHNQNEEKYSNGPIIDLFVNAQWKRACIFVKWENFNMGWPFDRADYFTAHRYINTTSMVKLGLFWPFYVQPGRGGGTSSSGSSGEFSADDAFSSGGAGMSDGLRVRR